MDIAIVDYGMGNLHSVARALDECGARPSVTSDPRALATAAAVVVPGVGAFSQGMAALRERRLDRVLIEDVAAAGVPLLGLCLGMQLFATAGSEGGDTAGLDVIPGSVRRIEPQGDERVPHVGWNGVVVERPSPLFEGIESGRDFYFVHSYHFEPADPEHVVATTPYASGLAAVVAHENVLGVQFHPEKSQRVGLRLLSNFLALAESGSLVPAQPAAAT